MKLYKLRILVLLSRQGKKIAITSGIHYLHLNFVVDKTPPSQGFKQPRRTPLGFFGWPIRSGFSLVLKCECITLFAALDNGGGWWNSPVPCPKEFSEMDLPKLVPLLDTSFLWLLLWGISAWRKFRSSAETVRTSLLVLELFALRVTWLWDYSS